MKKTHTFSRYIFMVLLVLESLTLLVVVGVLHAMLVKSIDREYHNQIGSHMAEIRLSLKDRHEHAQARLDELAANNGIKVALLLGMSTKATDVVTSLYPPANGVTFYIRNTSGDTLPQPIKSHEFIENMDQTGWMNFGDGELVPCATMTIFTRPIVRKGELVGLAIGIYDLVRDRNLHKLQKTFKNSRLFRGAVDGLTDISNGRTVKLSDNHKRILDSEDPLLRIADMLILPLKGYRQVYLAANAQQLDVKKQRLLANIVLLCIPLLGLALAASFMIIKKVTLPLNALADDARQITEGGAGHYLDEKKIKHVEFVDLTMAFNKALTRINQRNDQLLQLNQSLQNEIYERKQLVDALATSEKQLRSLQDNIPIGLFRTTPKGQLVHANPACLTINGYKHLSEFQSVDVNTLYENKEDCEKILNHLSVNGSLDGWQIRMRRKDGSLFWALLHIKLVTDAHHRDTYLDGTIQDISLQVKAENEKRQLETQLQQSQKMETIGTLAGGIAHDFNNLLASIMGFAELALEDSQSDSIQADNLNNVLVATQRATDLVGQILTFARQSDTEKKPVHLHLVIDEAIKLLRSTLPSTIKIRPNIQSRSAVMAAHTQLHQVVVNLCSNAGHAMRDTGGVLSITLTDVELKATHVEPDQLVKAGPNIKLTIKDTGHGISPEIMRRIFEPYYTTKKPGEGTGIGLSVVQGIVRSHGGFLTVDSIPGQGSAFDVYLPIIDRKDIPLSNSSTQIIGGNERILLVDDELLVIQMGQQMLERLGYDVTSRSDSVAAFELFQEASDQFDLVITDMTMPDMTGDKLAKRISDIRPDIPIILCTGYSNRLDHQNVTDSGVRAILYKPLVKNALANTIREVLTLHQTPTTLH